MQFVGTVGGDVVGAVGGSYNGSWGQLAIEGPAKTIEGDWRFQALPDLPRAQTVLPYGCGRSYGDSCINSGGSHLSTRRLNRFIRFDRDTGFLECEAGITLDEILRVVVPRGWFLPVLPGTRFVTVGGAIANDVHGKNHHSAGSFACHVQSLEVLRSDGSRTSCSVDQSGSLFAATIGGLGLTGLITRAALQLKKISSDSLSTQNIPFGSIEQFIAISRESRSWDYSVAWVDTTARGGKAGRGIFSRASHCGESVSLQAQNSHRTLSVPFSPPFSLINRWTVSAFNSLYYTMKARDTAVKCQHYQPFFFPLDAILNWNRVYGQPGFYQYQCVVPAADGCASIERLLAEVRESGEGSFLTVLKMFGERTSPGLLSFPRPGLTLAMDFRNSGDRVHRLFEQLDRIVADVGGALYPAKDARMSAVMFESAYPRLNEFVEQLDPRFSSAFWRRIQS